jgi:hypothetical protein
MIGAAATCYVQRNGEKYVINYRAFPAIVPNIGARAFQ